MAPLRWRQLFSRSSLAVGLQFALVGGLFGGLNIRARVRAHGRPGTVGLVAVVATGLAGTLSAGLRHARLQDRLAGQAARK